MFYVVLSFSKLECFDLCKYSVNCGLDDTEKMHLSMLTPRGGGGGRAYGVFDHQLHPHSGDFDQHFGPELGQFEPNYFY